MGKSAEGGYQLILLLWELLIVAQAGKQQDLVTTPEIVRKTVIVL